MTTYRIKNIHNSIVKLHYNLYPESVKTCSIICLFRSRIQITGFYHIYVRAKFVTTVTALIK